MVFKGRFFTSFSSSKKPSDSSSQRNSSRSPSSFGSPLRSTAKKSPKKPDSPSPFALSYRGGATPVKDSGSPAKKKDTKAGVGVAPVGKLNEQVDDDREREKDKDKDKERDSVALILTASLGLNKIKTRSGPLPHESYYGLQGCGTGPAKGVALGASNLSRPSNNCSGSFVFSAVSNGAI